MSEQPIPFSSRPARQGTQRKLLRRARPQKRGAAPQPVRWSFTAEAERYKKFNVAKETAENDEGGIEQRKRFAGSDLSPFFQLFPPARSKSVINVSIISNCTAAAEERGVWRCRQPGFAWESLLEAACRLKESLLLGVMGGGPGEEEEEGGGGPGDTDRRRSPLSWFRT